MPVPNFRPQPDMKIMLTTPDGENLHLHVPPHKQVFSIRGLGMSDRDIASTRGPFQHGETVLSQKIVSRDIALSLAHDGCNRSGWWGNRGTYIDYLRENRSAIYAPDPHILTFTYRENGVYKKRALDLFLTGGMELPMNNTDRWEQTLISEELTFVAHDPFPYDPELQTVSITSFDDELVLPMTFPFILGGYSGTTTVTYTGTWEAYPTIRVYGPASYFSIVNETIDKRIDYEGEVAAGDVITFDLRFDYKTVTDACGNDRGGFVSGDLGTFLFQCAPLATGGSNIINVYMETHDPVSTQIDFEYFIRYRGF